MLSEAVPAEGIHLTALREVVNQAALDAPARQRLLRHGEAARLGALLVDLPYFHRFAVEVVRYVAKLPPRPSAWGAALHSGGAISLLSEVIGVARRERGDTLGAIALGLASHLSIDRALHPLVNSLARRYPVGGNHDAAHREVEKFQSICFHEGYMGRDLMGTRAITGYLELPALAQLAEPELSARVRQAWAAALGSAPTAPELAGFGRGYRAHIRLIGWPVGKRIAPEAAKEAARPRYLHGAWGTFAGALAAAVTESARTLNAVVAMLDAGERELAAAQAALARVLPPGTIDPPGDEHTLERPFEPRLGDLPQAPSASTG